MVLKCLLVSFLIKGQGYSLAKADSLFKTTNYEQAATAYERVYFFSLDKQEKMVSLFGRANCFKILNRHYEAYNSLVRISSLELDDSLKCAANYQLALALYLSNYFNDAEKFCAKNYSIPINSKEYKNSILLHAFAYNELNSYKNARLKFTEYVLLTEIKTEHKDSIIDFIKSYYTEKNLPQLKSLRKARRLSKVLPGAGLFYAGKPGKALTNIGFQLLAVGYTGANVYFCNYVTAAVAGVFMIRSFYTGGVNQLNDIVPKFNNDRSRKFNDTFKNVYTQQLIKYEALK